MATMQRAQAVALAAVLWLAAGLFGSVPAIAQFSYVVPGDGRPLIIFLHGLGGSGGTSFRVAGSSKSWPELMRDDADRVRGARARRDYATATLSFPATCADRLTIPQVAANLIRTLYDDGIWTRHPSIIFIAYSLGGLVLQELLTTSQSDRRYGALVDRTAGVIFLATPAGGSDYAGALTTVLELVPGVDRSCPLVKGLQLIDGNALLQKLDADWRKFMRTEERIRGRERRLSSACLYETRPVLGVVIVGQNASTPVCDERFAMNEDHISIAKPESRSSEVYKRVRGLIADIDLLAAGKPVRMGPRTDAPPRPRPPYGLGLRQGLEGRADDDNNGSRTSRQDAAPRASVFDTLQRSAP